MFIHLSRFPAPLGLIDPSVAVNTPLYEPGGHIYRKLYGTSELAQAMLCHTDHASRIASPTFLFDSAYDNSLVDLMRHVVYPSVMQRRTESETSTAATPFFHGGIGIVLPNVAFTPWIYTTIDFVNAHAAWVRTAHRPRQTPPTPHRPTGSAHRLESAPSPPGSRLSRSCRASCCPWWPSPA